jgi:hypothetical protein
MGRPFPPVQAWGRHCADNNAGSQRYPFFGSFSDIWRSRHSASPVGGTHVQKLGTLVGAAIRSREDHSDEKITHHEGVVPAQSWHTTLFIHASFTVDTRRALSLLRLIHPQFSIHNLASSSASCENVRATGSYYHHIPRSLPLLTYIL